MKDKHHSSKEQLINEIEQLKAEIAELKKSKEEQMLIEKQLMKLSTVISQNPAVIVVTDINGNLEYVNERFTELTGYTFKEVAGKNTDFLKSGKEPPEFFKALWDTVSSGKVWHGELCRKRKNGDLFWAQAMASPVFDSKGKITNYLMMAIDITGRKKSEHHLQKQHDENITLNKKLKKALINAEDNENRLNTLLNSIPDIVCYKDGEGRWLLANKADLELFCLTGVDYKGKTDRELAEFTNEVYKVSFLTCMVSDEKAWQKKDISHGIETITTKYGEEKIYDVYKIPSFFPDGKRQGLTVIGRDITKLEKNKLILQKQNEDFAALNEEYQTINEELQLTNNELKKNNTKIKNINKKLNEALLKAQESDRLKTAFLHNMNHEIRTPMNGILGFAELLKTPGLSGEDQQDFIKIIEKSGNRMLKTINDLMDISMIEAGQVKIKNSEVYLNREIDELFNFFNREAAKKGLTLSTKYPGSGNLVVDTDQEKLYAVFSNLLKNAIKYTHQGTVEFGYTKEGGRLKFFVKDTGIGIPKEHQETIFNRFVQADIADKKAFQGNGLGLSISKSYIEMMGGKIWVTSQPDVGTTFYFTLPLTEIASHEAPLFKKKQSTKPVSKKPDKYKILIVEDEQTSNEYATIVVKTISRKTLYAANGSAAIDKLLLNPDIDIILMDIKMPVMNGYDATREIRRFNNEVIIIAQTAFAFSGDRQKALAAGCNDYIAKPFTKEDLLKIIEKHMKT